jgi:hypothetical protein
VQLLLHDPLLIFLDFSIQVLHLTTHVEVVNNTLLPFDVDVVTNGQSHYAGSCVPKRNPSDVTIPSSEGGTKGLDSRKSRSFSIPIPLLTQFYKDWKGHGNGTVTLRLTPYIAKEHKNALSPANLSGIIDLSASLVDLKRSPEGFICTRAEVTCRAHDDLGRSVHPFSLQVCIRAALVDNEHVTMNMSLEPRAVVLNNMPVALSVRTPMPRTYSVSKRVIGKNKEVTYELESQDRMEVFTPGPSIAISLRPRDGPVAGNGLGWMDAGWVDLPLVPVFSLQDPIVSVLPIVNEGTGERVLPRETGAEVIVVEGKRSLERLNEASTSSKQEGDGHTSSSSSKLQQNVDVLEPLSFFLTVRNYGVDHTGTLLFEEAFGSTNQVTNMMPNWWQADKNTGEFALHSMLHPSFQAIESFSALDSSRQISRVTPQPLGAFASSQQRRRITLLPNPNSAIRLLQMTMDGDEGIRRSMVRKSFVKDPEFCQALTHLLL